MRFPYTPPYASRRSPVLAENVVATSQPLAAQAGLTMLARGGNAIDAALAAAIALTVVEPTGNGVGSDAFCILWDGRKLHGLNASGCAPAGWTPARFKARTEMAERGWESVTVPGAVSAWVELSQCFGSEPAIAYAERGFLVSPIIAELWQRGGDLLSRQPGFADHFLPGGAAPQAGERFVNRPLAVTLTAIAETSGEAFYRGPLAEKIAACAAQYDAALTVEDLAAHQCDWVGTISQNFDNATLHEIPPNGQGIVALMALGILSHTSLRDFSPDDPLALHYQFEALKLALRDAQAYVADGAHMHNVTADDLLSPAYLAARAGEISPDRAQDFGAGAPNAGGTVYLSTADSAGMMVSYIQSNYAGFGSGVVVPETSIHLQNRGAGFSLQEGHPNQVAPGKRPFHTIILAMLMHKGAPLMSFGVMGGPIQAQGHVQMVLRTQLWGQDVQTAVDAPRWRITEGIGIACEPNFELDTLESLRVLGHNITLETPDTAFGFGGAQLVHRLPSGGYAAGSVPRKDGQAVGL